MDQNQEQEIIKKYTDEFVKSAKEPMPTIRSLLLKENINPQELIVVESFPDDANLLFFVVITKDKRVYQFEYDYLHKNENEGEIVRLKDITENYSLTPYRESVSLGLQMI